MPFSLLLSSSLSPLLCTFSNLSLLSPSLSTALRWYYKENAGWDYELLIFTLHMALTASKISNGPVRTKSPTFFKSNGIIVSWAQNRVTALCFTVQGAKFRQISIGTPLSTNFTFPNECLWHICRRTGTPLLGSPVSCQSTRTHNDAETKECVRNGHCSDASGAQMEDKENNHSVMPDIIVNSTQGLTDACKFAHNDAKFVSERARNDIVLLSRGIMRLDARAREDVAILGFEFLKLDARAREDTVKIDHGVKKKAERVYHIARILKNKAQSKLKTAADKHWSDGALEADLRYADLCAKQRAMEDALMALEFMKNIHDMMVTKLYKFPLRRRKGSRSANDVVRCITLEKNGKIVDFFASEVSTERITAIQEAYRSMASALSEVDGIDYTDPEELELLVAALIDLDAMDGKSSVSLLAECSSSPDVNMRKALTNALAAAPSMWTLGNAGMGALQRLAEDSNLSIAAAATRAIRELKNQWEIEEGDSWMFMMDQQPMGDEDDQEATGCEEA